MSKSVSEQEILSKILERVLDERLEAFENETYGSPIDGLDIEWLFRALRQDFKKITREWLQQKQKYESDAICTILIAELLEDLDK